MSSYLSRNNILILYHTPLQMQHLQGGMAIYTGLDCVGGICLFHTGRLDDFQALHEPSQLLLRNANDFVFVLGSAEFAVVQTLI